MPPKKPFAPRKLLVAAAGVATINYIAMMACGGTTDGSSSGNPPTSGNLPAPMVDSAPPPTSGNLAPPPDAGLFDAADAADAAEADTDGGDAG